MEQAFRGVRAAFCAALKCLIGVDMPKPGELFGWRELARITEANSRTEQILQRALHPNRELEKLRLIEASNPDRHIEKLRLIEGLNPIRIEKQQLIENALRSNREQLRLIERALYPKSQIESSLRLMEALRANQHSQATAAIQEAGRINKLLETQQREFRRVLETEWRELERSQNVLAREQLTNYASALHKTVRQLIDRNASLLRPYDISIGPGGEIALGGETTTSEEVAGELERLTKGLTAASTVTAWLHYLLEFFNSLKGPAKKVLFQIVLGYVVYVTAPMIDGQLRRLLGTSRAEAVLAVQEVAQSKFGPNQLEGYRFVKANRLRVHAGPAGQDDVTAELEFGKLVRVLDVKGQRTQVEFLQIDGAADIGWVATRHLASFTK
jgi:hypothetical protein